MKFVHRVSFASSPEVAEDLAQAGFDVAERARLLRCGRGRPALAACMDRHGAVDIVSTRFTKGEVRRAEVLELMTDWHHGYPQPERDMAYKSLTYDDSDYCHDCGGGLRQVAPFRMSREPRWGRRGILH